VPHQLHPGLFRQLKEDQKNIPDDLLDNESAMFFEFRSRAKEVHKEPLSDWDILFYMQHHGCKTRLLDWTENFAVALYFAMQHSTHGQSSPTIWLLNAYAMNEKYHDVRDLYSPEYLDTDEGGSYSDIMNRDIEFDWKKPIGLYPIRKVDRLTTQGGYFTIHGVEVQPINKLISEKANIWKKVVLPEKAIEGTKGFLNLAGINEFTLFPDLDGLSRYLNQKYF